jgi:cytoskeletal protein RodZ
LISDRLYLVPFLRRYATFLGLDAEEVASRFVSSVQHAEANVVRISQELTMAAKQPASSRRIVFAILATAVILLLADLVWRRFEDHEAAPPPRVESPAAMVSSAQAPNEPLPPATVGTNPEAAQPPASAPAISNVPQSAPVPPAANRSAPPRPVPPAATDN